MSTSPSQVNPSGVDRVKWREMLARFSEGELKDLCFDLGIDYEGLPGQGKADKARELVAHCERRDRADELEAAYKKYLRQPLRRFASRHRYALISTAGTTIIALALVLSAVIFNVGPLRGLLPTPRAFRPAEGESLIILADFEDRSGGKYTGIDPAQYIYEQLVARARQDQQTH